MNDDVFRARVGLLQAARGTGLVLRLLIVAAPFAAIACTRLAAHDGAIAVDVVAICLAFLCLVYPDSHVGVALLALLTGEWLATVDDAAQPWALGMAVSFLVFHTALAAAAVAPPSARWTPAMCRRWLRRAAVLLVASAVTMLAVLAADRIRMAGSGAVLGAALALLAGAGLWAAATGRDTPPSRS